LSALAVCFASAAQADPFGSGTNTFDIEFVTIGNPGNTADTTGIPDPAGKVDYTYRMGQFEISVDMINKANALGGLGITQDNRGPNKPATSISWFEAAQFVNWLNTDSGSTPAYKFDSSGNFQLWQPSDTGFNSNNLYLNSQVRYFLPSVDEWYKAAYYDPNSGVYFDYPTGSNIAPTPVVSGTAANTAVYDHSFISGIGPADITFAGGLSPYGTMGQGGNVSEWEETDFDLLNGSGAPSRGTRGGRYLGGGIISLQPVRRGLDDPQNEGNTRGFRVASIPEPSTMLLAVRSVSYCGAVNAAKTVELARCVTPSV